MTDYKFRCGVTVFKDIEQVGRAEATLYIDKFFQSKEEAEAWVNTCAFIAGRKKDKKYIKVLEEGGKIAASFKAKDVFKFDIRFNYLDSDKSLVVDRGELLLDRIVSLCCDELGVETFSLNVLSISLDKFSFNQI